MFFICEICVSFEYMVIDIIDEQYFKKTKFRRILSKIVLFMFIVCITLFAMIGLFSLTDYQVYLDILWFIFISLFFIIYFFDQSLYIRSGTIHFENNLMIITREDTTEHLDLTSIAKIKFKKTGRKWFILEIGKQQILIELTLDKKLKLFNKLEQYTVKVTVAQANNSTKK